MAGRSRAPDRAKPSVRKTLRLTDQEAARVVAVQDLDGTIVGAGCLIDHEWILTCCHVLKAALGPECCEGMTVLVSLPGVTGRPTLEGLVARLGDDGSACSDLALIKIRDPDLEVLPAEFASPLRHGGKRYSVLGFPGGDAQGRNARGTLFAADALGLVQMDREGSLLVEGGFSGAPVWSPDLNAFVGIVVTELSERDVAWCVPSQILSRFFEDLRVRFRIPSIDRPQVHDYDVDDPNVQIFGTASGNGERKLTATVKVNDDEDADEDEEPYVAKVTLRALPGSPPIRGHIVTFITYPDFESDGEDAYELFAEVAGGQASVEFYPKESFTVAAIADGGEMALTINLSEAKPKAKGFV